MMGRLGIVSQKYYLKIIRKPSVWQKYQFYRNLIINNIRIGRVNKYKYLGFLINGKNNIWIEIASAAFVKISNMCNCSDL